ncbi:MAG: acetyl-CoA carboxylase biotin carboxylase subunit [Oceanicoccus sp.]
MFNKVLVANRGEIAVRIINSVKAAGYQSVAVFSKADRDAAHVHLADEAVCIGPAQVNQSYLVIDNILDAARKTGADAIHPGYGFLSENAGFAKACTDAGIVFIGPSPEAIDLMGNKRIAKNRMIDAGVPCVPGYQGADQSNAVLLEKAKGIGYPLMVKAAAGGGGRGMRFQMSEEGLEDAIKSARTEALNAFGSDELILERAVINGRHIEIQVAADASGQTVYLGERDCSIQRRHQKVIEEAPSPFVDQKLRHLMGQAAVNAASACHYQGVGTVEFLVDADGSFFFLEMNTRLQVEHPVTELITGVDLVDWQLQIAAGDPLPLSQEEISLDGHAIEARLYAEDPANGFMPQTGKVLVWEESEGEGLRTDHCVLPGGDVSPHYDPMLAKVIAWGPTREDARRRLLRSLRETHLLGVTTNKAFLSQILQDQRFINGDATTAFIDDATLAKASESASPEDCNLALAAVLYMIDQADDGSFEDVVGWSWSNAAGMEYRQRLTTDETDHNIGVTFNGLEFVVAIKDGIENTSSHEIVLHSIVGSEAVATIDGVRRRAHYAIDNNDLWLDASGQTIVITNKTYQPAATDDEAGSGRVQATTEGLVIDIPATVGMKVSKGDLLVVIEAMKMEHRHLADGDGTVTEVNIQTNTQVKKGQLLVELALDEVSADEEKES